MLFRARTNAIFVLCLSLIATGLPVRNAVGARDHIADPPTGGAPLFDKAGPVKIDPKTVVLFAKVFWISTDVVIERFGFELKKAVSDHAGNKQEEFAKVLGELIGTLNTAQIDALIKEAETLVTKTPAEPDQEVLRHLLAGARIALKREEPADGDEKGIFSCAEKKSKCEWLTSFKDSFLKEFEAAEGRNKKFYDLVKELKEATPPKAKKDAMDKLLKLVDLKTILGFLEGQRKSGNDAVFNTVATELAMNQAAGDRAKIRNKSYAGEQIFDVIGQDGKPARFVAGSAPNVEIAKKIFDHAATLYPDPTVGGARALTYSPVTLDHGAVEGRTFRPEIARDIAPPATPGTGGTPPPGTGGTPPPGTGGTPPPGTGGTPPPGTGGTPPPGTGGTPPPGTGGTPPPGTGGTPPPGTGGTPPPGTGGTPPPGKANPPPSAEEIADKNARANLLAFIQAKCINCHNGKKTEGGVNFEDQAALFTTQRLGRIRERVVVNNMDVAKQKDVMPPGKVLPLPEVKLVEAYLAAIRVK